jgi:hypothetical protein
VIRLLNTTCHKNKNDAQKGEKQEEKNLLNYFFQKKSIEEIKNYYTCDMKQLSLSIEVFFAATVCGSLAKKQKKRNAK